MLWLKLIHVIKKESQLFACVCMTETYILWILDKHLKFRAKDILWNKVMKLAGHLVHQVGWWHWSRAISMDWISRQTLFRCKHCWTISLPRVDLLPDHDDDMTWKSFPHYWPSVWGIHCWPVDSPHKGPVIWSFCVFFVECQTRC